MKPAYVRAGSQWAIFGSGNKSCVQSRASPRLTGIAYPRATTPIESPSSLSIQYYALRPRRGILRLPNETVYTLPKCGRISDDHASHCTPQLQGFWERARRRSSALRGSGGLRDESFDVAPLVTDWLAEGMYTGVREDLQPSQSERPIPDWPWHFAPIIDAVVTSALTATEVSLGILEAA